MGQALRIITPEDGGCLIDGEKPNKQPIKQPLNNLEKWLSVQELAELCDISQQAVQKGVTQALAGKPWNGEFLRIKSVAGTRGRGGKTHLIYVDTLPDNLKQKWYLQRGIVLHEKVDPITGKTIMVAEQQYQPDVKHQRKLSIAQWRMDVIKPALAHPT